MSQANNSNITTGCAEDPARAARLAQAYRDLESTISDLANMAYIAAEMVEQAIGCPRDHLVLTGGRPDCFFIPDHQANAMSFAAYHTAHLVNEMREKYMEILESRAADPAPCGADVSKHIVGRVPQ
jgi:hypothetical protein